MTDAEYGTLLARGKVTARLPSAEEAQVWRAATRDRCRTAGHRVRTLQARTDPTVAAAYLIPEEAWRDMPVTQELLAAWQADLDAAVAPVIGQDRLL